jgi:microsomal dipeptidase-like Zn-dependent dipeptidase
MIVDLHAHYPMHLPATARMVDHGSGDDLGDLLRSILLDLANRLKNYPRDGHPVVTIENMIAGGVGVALSVAYAPFNELTLPQWDAAPKSHYFDDLLAILDNVEQSIEGRNDVRLARNPHEMDDGIAPGKLVLIHAVEGGFQLGATEAEIQRNMATLKARGVAYITVAHLLYRQVATNAPAITGMSDADYNRHFPQPAFGLTDRGRTLIAAMADAGILIDVTHMSVRGINETIAFLESIHSTVPVIATHAACGGPGLPEYNITDDHIRAIQKRGGVVGLIACSCWMSAGGPVPATFDESMNLFSQHVHGILNATNSTDFAAIGSDMDGFIKPALPGIGSPLDFPRVEARLTEINGGAVAQQICSGNALRVLRNHWKGNIG